MSALEQVQLDSALTHPLPAKLWRAPDLHDGQPAPLLWCHDGSGYEWHCRISDWAQRSVEAGVLPGFRLLLVDARNRRQLFSVSPRYLRTFSRALTDLQSRVGDGPVAVMGSSLGGLTSLAAGLRDKRVSSVLAQSGSFFLPRTDGQERGFPWFGRINRFVAEVEQLSGRRLDDARDRLGVVMSCGLEEENLHNNRHMARLLTHKGFRVQTDWIPGGHDFGTWCAGLDPLWRDALARDWAGRGWAA